jgi:hypothetical protein
MAAAAAHGNEGFRVKNLHHTSNCSHKLQSGSWFDHIDTKATICMVNGCQTKLTSSQKRGCHVVSANQNTDSGQRFLVAMCAEHNAYYDSPLDIRLNAAECALECKCGHLEPPPWDKRKCKMCKQL